MKTGPFKMKGMDFGVSPAKFKRFNIPEGYRDEAKKKAKQNTK